jgi:murein DD-endopeptidase MepM/ murein hydrolase activator NlpD
MITWPLLRNTIRKQSVSNTFGMVRKHSDGTPKPHQGWDFAAPIATPLYAIGSGKVVFVRSGGDYGLQLCHAFTFRGRELYAFYAHLHSVVVGVQDTVQIDAQIGLTGASGNASNLKPDEHHLHFEIREHANLGLGLAGRISPILVFGTCPLRHVADGSQMIA